MIILYIIYNLKETDINKLKPINYKLAINIVMLKDNIVLLNEWKNSETITDLFDRINSQYNGLIQLNKLEDISIVIKDTIDETPV